MKPQLEDMHTFHRCLLELLHAKRHNIPMMMIEVKDAGWTYAEARSFVDELESTLPLRNPNAMQTLEEYLGTQDLTELKEAIFDMLSTTEATAIQWNPSARDTHVLATAQVVSHCGSWSVYARM